MKIYQMIISLPRYTIALNLTSFKLKVKSSWHVALVDMSSRLSYNSSFPHFYHNFFFKVLGLSTLPFFPYMQFHMVLSVTYFILFPLHLGNFLEDRWYLKCLLFLYNIHHIVRMEIVITVSVEPFVICHGLY